MRRRLLSVLMLTLAIPTWAEVASEPALLSPLASRSIVLSVARSGNALVAVGERGHVLRSSDGGRSWVQRPSPTRVTLTAVRFAGDIGWAVGHSGVVLNSTDAGLSWTLVPATDRQPWFDVLPLETGARALGVGADGRVAWGDGRGAWQLLKLPEAKQPTHFYGVVAVEGGFLLAGERGALVRMGASFSDFVFLTPPTRASLFGISTAGKNTVVAFGLKGALARSLDGGGSWKTIDSGTSASITSATDVSDGRIILATDAGQLLALGTDDEVARPVREPMPLPITSLVQAADGGLVLATLRGLRRVDLPPASSRAPS